MGFPAGAELSVSLEIRLAKHNTMKRKIIYSSWGVLIVVLGAVKSGNDVVYYKELPLVDPWFRMRSSL